MGAKRALSNYRQNISCRISRIRFCRKIFGTKREEITGEWGKTEQ